jgi:hypothetical protein
VCVCVCVGGEGLRSGGSSGILMCMVGSELV